MVLMYFLRCLGWAWLLWDLDLHWSCLQSLWPTAHSSLVVHRRAAHTNQTWLDLAMYTNMCTSTSSVIISTFLSFQLSP